MIPPTAINLILSAEGVDQPGKWPGGESGITLGHGYDLSAETADELARDWTPHLGREAVRRLASAAGLSGERARLRAAYYGDIVITRTMADAVFFSSTLPKYETQTSNAFPGFDQLSGGIQGALVSLVFNRGTLFADDPNHPQHDRRREMRAIRDAIALAAGGHKWGFIRWPDLPKDWLGNEIAAQLESMKRLWAGKGLDGLLARRDAEAALAVTTA